MTALPPPRTDIREERGPGWVLRLGDFRAVLDGVRCDAVITDPPYSERTHSGYKAGGWMDGRRHDGAAARELCYSAWSQQDTQALFDAADAWGAGWIVAMSDHALVSAYEAVGKERLSFAPIPWVAPGSRVRLQGDGPAYWATWLNVSRPRTEPWSKWGALPGAYVYTSDRGGHIGGKPIALMRALVRDYSRKGDLVCDPCAGGATTLLAAVTEGRSAIGAEIDPETFEKAVKRLRRGYTQTFDFGAA